MRFIIYRTWFRQYRWKLLAANNRSIAISGESYHNYADCVGAIDLVRFHAASLSITGANPNEH